MLLEIVQINLWYLMHYLLNFNNNIPHTNLYIHLFIAIRIV